VGQTPARPPKTSAATAAPAARDPHTSGG
jgi:hypothetical protein